jgi:hypothetical protein
MWHKVKISIRLPKNANNTRLALEAGFAILFPTLSTYAVFAYASGQTTDSGGAAVRRAWYKWDLEERRSKSCRFFVILFEEYTADESRIEYPQRC